MDGEDPSSLRILGISHQILIGAQRPAADGKKIMALCQHVGIEHDLFRLIQRTFPARENGILLPLFVAGVIKKTVALIGNGHVRLFDSSFDFLEELLLQRLGMSHDAIGILVLGVEIGENLRVIATPQPVVVVHTQVAMFFKFGGNLFRHSLPPPALHLANLNRIRGIFRGSVSLVAVR